MNKYIQGRVFAGHAPVEKIIESVTNMGYELHRIVSVEPCPVQPSKVETWWEYLVEVIT